MHWKRWITALILIPPLLLLILKGSPVLFTIVIIVVSMLSLWEYFRIVYDGHMPPVGLAFTGWSYVGAGMCLCAVHHGHFAALIGVLALHLIITAIVSIRRYTVSHDAPIVAVKQIAGMVYIPILFSFLILIRMGENGPLWVLFLFWVVAWGDTGALYAGTYLGKHKLCRAVSPNKTIEGAVGGLLANLLFGWIFKLLFFHSMGGLTCTIFALAVGGAGQVGDLFESVFKRASSIKDSSNLIPGHGGFLDRLDALLFAAPIGFYLKEYLLP
jgi:phosphatidate cytidylyltransferase